MHVVFVCEHGAAKSVVAATLFNRLAEDHGLAARAVSRGTDPDEEIPPSVRDGLRAEGFDLSDLRPIGVGAIDPSFADLLIVFDVSLPTNLAALPLQRWDGMPAVMESFPIARDAIAKRVASLVDSRSGSRSSATAAIAR